MTSSLARTPIFLIETDLPKWLGSQTCTPSPSSTRACHPAFPVLRRLGQAGPFSVTAMVCSSGPRGSRRRCAIRPAVVLAHQDLVCPERDHGLYRERHRQEACPVRGRPWFGNRSSCHLAPDPCETRSRDPVTWAPRPSVSRIHVPRACSPPASAVSRRRASVVQSHSVSAGTSPGDGGLPD